MTVTVQTDQPDRGYDPYNSADSLRSDVVVTEVTDGVQVDSYYGPGFMFVEQAD